MTSSETINSRFQDALEKNETTKVVSMMTEHPVLMHYPTRDGWSVAQYAAFKGKMDILMTIESLDFTVLNKRTPKNRLHPAIIAGVSGNIRCFTYIIESTGLVVYDLVMDTFQKDENHGLFTCSQVFLNTLFANGAKPLMIGHYFLLETLERDWRESEQFVSNLIQIINQLKLKRQRLPCPYTKYTDPVKIERCRRNYEFVLTQAKK
jgi:hypothetical protein